MKKTWFSPMLAAFALSGAAIPAMALEDFSGDIVPYSADKMIMVIPFARDPDPSVASKGHYEIYVSPFTALPNPQGPCTTLNRTATLQVQQRLRKAEQERGIPGIRPVDWKQVACTDLNGDGNLESVMLGFSDYHFGAKYYNAYLFSENQQVNDEMGLHFPNLLADGSAPAHRVMARPPLNNEPWPVLLTWRTTRIDEEGYLAPWRMDDASKRYQSSKFIYNNGELRFSTREKKLVDSEFDTSFIDSAGGVVTDRAGHLLGYIHTEAQTFSSFIVPFVAVLDLQHKKFRHFNLGTDPKFKAALNRAYPGLWKRLEARDENGFGIERYKVVGFQQRHLIFKVELTDFKTSQSVFAGFWSYSLATGQVKLVSQKSNAPIKVEFKGTAAEIDVRDEGG